MVARNATNARSAASSSRRKAARTSVISEGEAQSDSPSLRERLRLLYFGNSETAHRFRYGLLVFDIATILFIIATSFMARAPWLEWLDLIFGLLILADFCASGRLIASGSGSLCAVLFSLLSGPIAPCPRTWWEKTSDGL